MVLPVLNVLIFINRTLNNSGMSHDVAEWRGIERFEQATDNSSNSQETFVEGWQVRF